MDMKLKKNWSYDLHGSALGVKDTQPPYCFTQLYKLSFHANQPCIEYI